MSIIALEGFDFYGETSGVANADTETNIRSRISLWANNSTKAVYADSDSGHAVAFRGNQNDSAQPAMFYTQYSVGGKNYLHHVGGLSVHSQPFNYYSYDRSPYVVGMSCGSLVSVKARKSTDTGTNFIFELNLPGGTIIDIAEVSDGIDHFLEWDFNITSGVELAYKFWVNGNLQLDGAHANASYTECSRWGLGSTTRDSSDYYTGCLWLDHMYLLDAEDASQGAAFQSRLGPLIIRPTNIVANGTNQFSPAGAASNWEAVKESPGPNDKDATYAMTSSVPRTQAFKAQVVDSGLSMLAITAIAAVKQDTPAIGIADLSFHASDGTTQTDASGAALQSVYRQLTHDYVVMPDSSPINVANLEAAEWGIKVEAAEP